MTLSQKQKLLAVVMTIAISLAIGLGLFIYIKGVLAYQKNVPAGTKIGALDIGQTPRQQLKEKIDKHFAQINLYFNLPTGVQKVALSDTGAAVDSKKLADRVNKDISRLRFIWPLLKPKQYYLIYQYDKNNLSKFAANYSKKISVAKAPSRFELIGDEVKVKPGNNAISYDTAEIAKLIEDQLNGDYIKLVVKPKPITTPIQIESLNSTAKAIQAKIEPPVDFAVEGNQYQTTKKQRFEWLRVVEDEKTGQHAIQVDRQKINDYLASLAKNYYKAPVATKVSLYDGAETGRTNGVSGRYLPVEQLLNQLTARLDNQTVRSVAVNLAPIAPPTQYSRNYSRTSRGIGLLIADFAAEKRISMGVVFREVNGPIAAEYNAQGRYVTASTFKIMLAYAVLKKIENGALSLQNQTIWGQSVQSCLEEMILKSTNPPAYALHHIYGFDEIDPFLHSQGFGATILDNYDAQGQLNGDKTTTASDMSNFFTRLAQGSLLNPNNTNWLLNLMQRQIWRSGIPAGSTPSVVADKVGFLGSYVHDSGIVYDPSGQYVLTVYTRGGSFAMIADLARRIHNLY